MKPMAVVSLKEVAQETSMSVLFAKNSGEHMNKKFSSATNICCDKHKIIHSFEIPCVCVLNDLFTLVFCKILFISGLMESLEKNPGTFYSRTK